jgi:uncharacterized protein YeaO (DUF488 family)
MGEDTPHPIEVERAYGSPGRRGPRARVLVDRVWPRGVARESLGIDLWLRDIAPSNELRKWFGHRPERWEEFRRRYLEELEQEDRRAPLEQLVELARRGPLTLLYGARDEQRNQAVVLREIVYSLSKGRRNGDGR